MPANQAIPEQPSLLDLVESKRWQRLQDHFANILGIAVRSISPSHALLVPPSWPQCVSADPAVKLLKIGEEIEQLIPSGDPPRDTTSITTPIGVTYAAVPLFAEPPRVLAYFLVGPMMVGPREDKARFLQRVTAMGTDAQAI